LKYSEKTIPYRLTPAELENLRLLRKRTRASGIMQEDEEEKRSAGEEAPKADADPLEDKTVRASS
jgi:hypothetical protein